MANKNARTELTRQEMEKIIKGGGSVMIGGNIITKVSGLPETEESLAAAESELEARKAKAASGSSGDDETDETDLDTMTKAELIEFAKANDIAIKSSGSKEEIRQAIEESLAE
jgi:hypothetical protein